MKNNNLHIIFKIRTLNALFIVAYLFSGFYINAGNAFNVDADTAISLIHHKKTDTTNIGHLISLAYQALDENKADSAIANAKKAYQLAFETSAESFWQRYGSAHSQLIMAKAHYMKKAYPQALSFYLRSLNEFNSKDEIHIISEINYEIGMTYFSWEVYEKAIEYFRISKNQVGNNQQKHIMRLQAMASAFNHLNYADSAQIYYSRVLEYYTSQQDFQSAIAILKQMSDINKNEGKFNLSVENELLILAYYKTLGQVNGEITTLNNLGFLYKYLNDFDKSLSYFKKSIELSENRKQLASVYINIGVIYHNQGNYESAMNYLFDALKICQSNKNLPETGKVYNLLASTYLFIEDIETAINYVKMAIEIGEKINDLNLLYQSYLIAANIYREEGNFEQALENYSKYSSIKNSIKETNQLKENEKLDKKYAAEKTEKELKLILAEEEIKDLVLKQLLLEKEKRENELSLQKENNLLLQRKYELEKATSDQRLQLISQKLNAEKKDREITELNNEKKLKDLALKQKEIEKKEQEKEIQLLESNNLILEQEKELDKLKDEKNQAVRKLLIAAIFVALFVLALILYYYFRKLKTNKLLTLKNTEISQQKISIEKQANALHKMNEHLQKLDRFKESLTGMIVHDLKNPLNSLLNTSQMERVRLLANKMLLMVMNILDIQKFEDAALELTLKNEVLNSVAEIAIDQVIMAASEKNIEIKNNTYISSTVRMDSEMIERVLVNLLTNAIKYTPVNGSIQILAEITDNENIRVEVSDTGQGIPADKIHLVFERFGQVDPKKLGEIRSSGLGLSFCKLAVEAHGGHIGVNSEAGAGATFWFTLQKAKALDITGNRDEKTEEVKNNRLSASSFLVLKPFIISLQQIKYYEITELRKILSQLDDSMLNKEITEWKEQLTNAISSGNKLLYEELINLNVHEA